MMDPGKFKTQLTNLKNTFDVIDAYWESTVIPRLRQLTFVGRTPTDRIIHGHYGLRLQITQVFDQLTTAFISPGSSIRVTVTLSGGGLWGDTKYIITNKIQLINWLRGRIMNYRPTDHFLFTMGLPPSNLPVVGSFMGGFGEKTRRLIKSFFDLRILR